MAFQVSPGINISEQDLTTVVPNVATAIGAIAGAYQWGPVLERTSITTENNLVDVFGKPDDVIHEDNNKILVFKTKKYKITCVRKFTIDKKGIISGFNSRNCF